MERNLIGNNIKNLRKTFGETQMDLAYALGLDSPNAISNYEKGIRLPRPEIRKKIASHYRITEDELVYSNLSEMSLPAYQLNYKDALLSILPIIHTDNAMEDIDFKNGYEAHNKEIETLNTEQNDLTPNFDICIDAYFDSYYKNKTPEALCNILWWFLLMTFSICNQWVSNGSDDLKHHKLCVKDFMKKYYLRDCSDDYISCEMSDNDKQDLSELNKIVVDLLQELNKYPEYNDLVAYYSALRYIFGCVDNELTFEMNKTIGAEMMNSLCLLKNKYANKFLNIELGKTK